MSNQINQSCGQSLMSEMLELFITDNVIQVSTSKVVIKVKMSHLKVGSVHPGQAYIKLLFQRLLLKSEDFSMIVYSPSN